MILVFSFTAAVGQYRPTKVATFKKITYFTSTPGGKEKRVKGTRLVVDGEKKTITVLDPRSGNQFAQIPADKVRKIVYERSAHRRYKAAAFVTIFLLFTKGKKHWVTLEFEDVPEHPIGNIYFRMDKDNYRRILATLQSATGVTVEEFIER